MTVSMTVMAASIYIVGVSVILFGVGVFSMIFFSWIKWYIDNREFNEKVHLVRAYIAEMTRWCGYEYPVLEDAGAYIDAVLDGLPTVRMNDFRDNLRRKYPKDNVGNLKTLIMLSKGILENKGDASWNGRAKVLINELMERYKLAEHQD